MTVESLKLILWAMLQPGTVYILGAGASYGLIPFTPGLRRIMAAEFHVPGIYSVGRPIPTNLYRRVMAGAGKARDMSEALFRRTITEPALGFLVQRALWRPMGKDVPANYRVFELVGAPSVLLNFNLDGMANSYCGNRHIVFEPHGRIDAERFASRIYGDLLDATMAYDLALPDIRYKLLPGPEPSCITRRFAYRALPRWFENAPSVLIVGYSFGKQENGFDDSESLEFFVELLRRTGKHAFVLSPSPEELTEILQQRVSLFSVTGISVRWELFARLLLARPWLLGPRAGEERELRNAVDGYLQAEEIALAGW